MALKWNIGTSTSFQKMEVDEEPVTIDDVMDDIPQKSSKTGILPILHSHAGKKVTIRKKVKRRPFKKNIDIEYQLANDFSAMNLYLQGKNTRRKKRNSSITVKHLKHRTWSKHIEDLGLHLDLFKTNLSIENLEKLVDDLIKIMLSGNTHYDANKIHLYDVGGMVMRYLIKRITQKVYSPGFVTTNLTFVVTDKEDQKKWSDLLPNGIKCQIVDEQIILEKFVKVNELIYYAVNYREF